LKDITPWNKGCKGILYEQY